jgi:RNA polymerase sigma factor (TIGR02999 family)
MHDVTVILSAIEKGDPAAAEKLLPLVYDALRKLAAQKLENEKPGQTLQATALVHEAYVRLVDVVQPQQWNSRGHFFAAAAEAMRRILVERARRRQCLRHGGGRQRLDANTLETRAANNDAADEDLLAVHEALERFVASDPEAAQVVKLRYFGGLTIEQTADALSMSVSTANRHWAYAKAWLLKEMTAASDAARMRISR